MDTATSPAPPVNRQVTSELPPVEGPVWVAWREGTLTRAKELEVLCDWVYATDPKAHDDILVTAIHRHLAAARDAALVAKLNPRRRFRVVRNGPLLERATSNLDAAEAHLLSLAPAPYLLGQMPCLLMHVQCHLSSPDPRRQEFERIARRLGIKDPDHPLVENASLSCDDKLCVVEEERRKIVTIVRGASSAALREHVRLRSFRNIVVVTGVFMAMLAIGVALTGFFNPTLIPVDFRTSWGPDLGETDRLRYGLTA